MTTIRVDPEGRGTAERLDTLGRFMRLLGEVNCEGWGTLFAEGTGNSKLP